MSSNSKTDAFSGEMADNHQYSRKRIHCYERVFGPTWVSTGGLTTTKEIYLQLSPKPRQKVLDIGCGAGGSAFFAARQYGCVVTGVDLSPDMISIAKDRLNWEEKIVRDRVTFQSADIFEMNFPANEFDLIYVRDVIMHIEHKEVLFRRILQWLKPGGTFAVTEYVKRNQSTSPELREYLERKNYFYKTISEYQNSLEKAGFKVVEAQDLYETFSKISEEELKYFSSTKDAFILDFGEDDYNWIIKNWQSKIDLINSGDQSWAFFICTK